MAFDNLCKVMAEQNPQDFVLWLLGKRVKRVKVLKTELGIEPIRADSVTFLQSSKAVLHLEFQTETGSQPALPLRMLDYWVRLYRKYNLPVIQILVMLRETKTDIPNEFRVRSTRHRYKVVKLWEQDSDFFLENEAMLPLAVLTKQTPTNNLLETVAKRIKNIENVEMRRSLLTQANVFAGLRFDEKIINQLLRENFMKDSVTYQAIVREGVQEGMQQGKEIGVKQGKEIGVKQGIEQMRQREAVLLVRQLERQVGGIEEATKAEIAVLPQIKLEDLGLALFDFESPADLAKWLKDND